MNIKSFLLILITSFILLSIANNKIENKKDNRREYVGVESKHATPITNDFYFNISTNANEREWMLALSSQLHGVTEYSIKMGRIDILTKTDAIEVDYFHKWHESIGQALHYSIETKRRPTIALISFKTNDNVEYVNTICSNYNIRVIMLRQRL
jgi:hypothetical protein